MGGRGGAIIRPHRADHGWEGGGHHRTTQGRSWGRRLVRVGEILPWGRRLVRVGEILPWGRWLVHVGVCRVYV